VLPSYCCCGCANGVTILLHAVVAVLMVLPSQLMCRAAQSVKYWVGRTSQVLVWWASRNIGPYPPPTPGPGCRNVSIPCHVYLTPLMMWPDHQLHICTKHREAKPAPPPPPPSPRSSSLQLSAPIACSSIYTPRKIPCSHSQLHMDKWVGWC
jgi:hypothetical protein